MEEFLEHLMDEVLEYGGGVDQAIRHNEVLVVSSRGHKGHLPLVPLTYPDEVISAAEVQLGEDSGNPTEKMGLCTCPGAPQYKHNPRVSRLCRSVKVRRLFPNCMGSETGSGGLMDSG